MARTALWQATFPAMSHPSLHAHLGHPLSDEACGVPASSHIPGRGLRQFPCSLSISGGSDWAPVPRLRQRQVAAALGQAAARFVLQHSPPRAAVGLPH